VATDLQVAGDHLPGGGSGFRKTAAFVALGLGLAGLLVSAAGLVIQLLPRHFTAGQQQAIMAWEVKSRWQQMPAGKVFPELVGYSLPDTVIQDIPPLQLQALRVAIAPQSGCAAGVTDTAVAAVLHRDGCEAILRATYVDQTLSFVMTVGVAVLPTANAAAAASSDLSGTELAAAHDPDADLKAGVRTVRFPGATGGLYDYSRQFAATMQEGPYLVLYAAGYSDGRPRVQLDRDPYSQAEMASMAQGVASVVANRLGVTPALPHCPGAPGC
jgi:hypothetical protein